MAGIAEWLTGHWNELIDRPSGPMAFRFVLQPMVASIFAVRDGMKDARAGRPPYLWTILTDPVKRMPTLREGFRATLRIIILSLVMELIYQLTVFRAFYPGQALIITFVIAFLPYLLLRGPVTRVANLWIRRRHQGAGHEHA